MYGNNVNQTLIMSIMKGMTSRTRTVNGKPTSLCDLGYCDVGLDDMWQACDSPDAAPGMHYHDKEGNPIVNKKVFPDLKQMTDYAHSLGLTSGWYGNNCGCSDHCSSEEECEEWPHVEHKWMLTRISDGMTMGLSYNVGEMSETETYTFDTICEENHCWFQDGSGEWQAFDNVGYESHDLTVDAFAAPTNGH